VADPQISPSQTRSEATTPAALAFAASRDARGILSDDAWKVHWGDGMDIQIDPTDWRRVYTDALANRVSAGMANKPAAAPAQ
jgi:hypothetical protein